LDQRFPNRNTFSSRPATNAAQVTRTAELRVADFPPNTLLVPYSRSLGFSKSGQASDNTFNRCSVIPSMVIIPRRVPRFPSAD